MMRKHVRVLSLILIVQIFLITPLMVRGIEEGDYDHAEEKIFKKIETITFTYSSTTLTYTVNMGVMFEDLNETHSRLRLDLFIHTADDNYITCLVVAVTHNTTFILNDIPFPRQGMVNGRSSCPGFQFSNLLYTMTVCTIDIPKSTFPINLLLSFDYFIDSSAFSRTNSTTASATFYGPAPIAAIVLGIVLGGAAIAVVSVVVIKRKARNASSYTSLYKAQRVSEREMKKYEQKKQAEAKADAEEAAKEEAEVTARAAAKASLPNPNPPLGMEGAAVAAPSQGALPAGIPSLTKCPGCGGNVVNFKCQDCWGKICRGCQHLNLATSVACEKCGRTL